MPARQHYHPQSLVPGRKAVAHRVDSHQDLKQAPGGDSPIYEPYLPEYAPALERARKTNRRNHRVVGGSIFGSSLADSGTNVADLLSNVVSAAASHTAPTLEPVPAQAQAVPQSSHLAHRDVHSQAHPHARASAQPSHPARPEASTTQAPGQAVHLIPRKSLGARPPMNIRRHPLPSTQRPAIPQLLIHALTPLPAPAITSAIVHVLSFLEDARGQYFKFKGKTYRKDTTRDSMLSNIFVEAGQLDSNVAPPLLRYVENPRTKLEQFKQMGREFWFRWV